MPLEIARGLVLEHRAVGFFPRTLVADEPTRGTPLAPAAEHLVAAITAQARRLGLVPPARRRRLPA